MTKKLILKGCPFCGAKAFWFKGNKETKCNDRVECQECFAEIEGTKKPQSALDLWNMRVGGYYSSKSDRFVTIEGENLD